MSEEDRSVLHKSKDPLPKVNRHRQFIVSTGCSSRYDLYSGISSSEIFRSLANSSKTYLFIFCFSFKKVRKRCSFRHSQKIQECRKKTVFEEECSVLYKCKDPLPKVDRQRQFAIKLLWQPRKINAEKPKI